MASFGDFKNNVAKLRKYLTKMNIFEELDISKTEIEEKELRMKNIDFFLQLIHHVFTSYSGDFYSVVLEIIPNIKTLSDKKFTESVLNISRKILKMDPQITAEQILSSKYIEKKVEFIADLCMNIFEWQASYKKKPQSTKEIKEVKTNELKNYMYEQPVIKQSYSSSHFNDFDEDELLEQREITVEPTQYNFQQIGHTFGKGSNNQLQKRSNEEQISSNKQKNTIPSFNNKPNIFPKNMRNEYLQDDLDNEEENNKQIANQSVAAKKDAQKYSKATEHTGYFQSKPTNLVKTKLEEEETQETDTVSRQQFNEALMMISNMNKTLNDMVSKFNSFQGNVVSWMTNIEARFSIIEQNVKTIKANL